MNFKIIILSIFPIISYGMTRSTSASITHACLIDFHDEERWRLIESALQLCRGLPKQEREWLGQDKECTTLATKLRKEPADVQLCIQEKNVIAYLVKNDIENRVHISWLCVAPKHRRCGLGRLLINKLYMQAKMRQKDYLQLYVKPDNYQAQAFYKKIGFKKDGLFLKKRL